MYKELGDPVSTGWTLVRPSCALEDDPGTLEGVGTRNHGGEAPIAPREGSQNHENWLWRAGQVAPSYPLHPCRLWHVHRFWAYMRRRKFLGLQNVRKDWRFSKCCLINPPCWIDQQSSWVLFETPVPLIIEANIYIYIAIAFFPVDCWLLKYLMSSLHSNQK